MNKKILVMHTDASVREVLAAFLRRMEGIANGRTEIVCLEDGNVGESFIKDNLREIGLAVVDEMIKNKGGKDLARIIRTFALAEGLKVPVLITTSRREDEDRAHRQELLREAPVFCFVEEGGFTRTRLEKALREAIASVH